MAQPLNAHREHLHEQMRMRHQREAQRPVEEKVRILLEMQHTLLPIIASRRPLHWYEKPWDIEP